MFLPLVLAALALSPEVPISTEAQAAAAGRQIAPAVASDGSAFFATWVHWVQPHSKGGDLVGSRISEDGAVLDRGNGIPLAPTEVPELDPSLVWNGSTYVSLHGVGTIPWVYGARIVEVSASGEVLATRDVIRGRVITNTDLAWNGSVYLAVWREEDGKARGLILDRSFNAVSPELVLADDAGDVAVASNGANFLAAWYTRSATFASAVAADGTMTPPGSLASNATSIDVASNGTSYAVFAGGIGVFAIDAASALTHRQSMPSGIEAALAWNGLRWVAAYSSTDRVFVAELNADLGFARMPERLVAQDSVQRAPAIASNAARTLVLWTDRTAERIDIRSAFLGNRTATSLVSWGLPHQLPVAAVWSRDGLGVLWREGDWGLDALRFGRFSDAGMLLSGEGTRLEASANADLATNGSQFAVAAERSTGVEVELLSAEGAPLGAPIAIGAGTAPKIVSAGRDFYVAWQTPSAAVSVRRVGIDRSLGPVQELPPVFADATLRYPADVVWTGQELVVLTVERTMTKYVSFTVASTTINAAGAVEPPVTITSEIGMIYGGVHARALFDGKDVVYVWATRPYGIHIRRGVNGPETFDESLWGFSSVGWDGNELVFIAHEPYANVDVLQRGSERVALPLEAPLLYGSYPLLAVAPGHRALLYFHTVFIRPGLLDQIAERGFVRFIEVAAKRRAARR